MNTLTNSTNNMTTVYHDVASFVDAIVSNDRLTVHLGSTDVNDSLSRYVVSTNDVSGDYLRRMYRDMCAFVEIIEQPGDNSKLVDGFLKHVTSDEDYVTELLTVSDAIEFKALTFTLRDIVVLYCNDGQVRNVLMVLPKSLITKHMGVVYDLLSESVDVISFIPVSPPEHVEIASMGRIFNDMYEFIQMIEKKMVTTIPEPLEKKIESYITEPERAFLKRIVPEETEGYLSDLLENIVVSNYLNFKPFMKYMCAKCGSMCKDKTVEELRAMGIREDPEHDEMEVDDGNE